MSDNTHGRIVDESGDVWHTITDGEIHTLNTPSGMGVDFDSVVQSGDDSLLKMDGKTVADTDGKTLPYEAIERHFTALIWEHYTENESGLSDGRTSNGSLITESSN